MLNQGFAKVAFREGPCACGASSCKQIVEVYALSAHTPQQFVYMTQSKVLEQKV